MIARPFVGEPGAWKRTTNRRDFSIVPPGETLLDALAAAGIPRTGVGPGADLFAGRGIQGGHTTGNAEGIERILDWIRSGSGFLFGNLVDFDQLYGHRNDVPGFYKALREFDDALPAISAALHEDDLLFITADHGNDPTTPTTDHARENVPRARPGASCAAWAIGRRRVLRRSWRDRRRVDGVAVSRCWKVVSAADRGAMNAQPQPASHDTLRAAATAAMGRAYAPYSEFRVGAALLASDGTIIAGCNVENSSFPAGICAERGAIAAAVASGYRDFTELAIVTDADDPTSPCGMCRQVLMEFAPNLQVMSYTTSGAEARWSLADLLPHPFTPQSLHHT